MRKGVAPIAAAAIAIIVMLVVESVILVNYVYRIEGVIRAAKETEIISAINTMEFTKRALVQALSYSFNQASYDVASRGGYSSLAAAQSYNCIPYWINYSSKNFPDYQSSLENSTLSILNKYRVELKDDVSIPQFTKSEIEEQEGKIKISVGSNDLLRLERPNFYSIIENSTITTNKISKILRLFKIGEDVADKVSEEITGLKSFTNVADKVSSLQAKLNDDYSSDNVDINLLSSENLGSSDSNFAVRILIKITDKSSYLLYDFNEKSVAARNIQLKFYVLSGKEKIEILTDVCEEINY